MTYKIKRVRGKSSNAGLNTVAIAVCILVVFGILVATTQGSGPKRGSQDRITGETSGNNNAATSASPRSEAAHRTMAFTKRDGIGSGATGIQSYDSTAAELRPAQLSVQSVAPGVGSKVGDVESPTNTAHLLEVKRIATIRSARRSLAENRGSDSVTTGESLMNAAEKRAVKAAGELWSQRGSILSAALLRERMQIKLRCEVFPVDGVIVGSNQEQVLVSAGIGTSQIGWDRLTVAEAALLFENVAAYPKSGIDIIRVCYLADLLAVRPVNAKAIARKAASNGLDLGSDLVKFYDICEEEYLLQGIHDFAQSVEEGDAIDAGRLLQELESSDKILNDRFHERIADGRRMLAAMAADADKAISSTSDITVRSLQDINAIGGQQDQWEIDRKGFVNKSTSIIARKKLSGVRQLTIEAVPLRMRGSLSLKCASIHIGIDLERMLLSVESGGTTKWTGPALIFPRSSNFVSVNVSKGAVGVQLNGEEVISIADSRTDIRSFNLQLDEPARVSIKRLILAGD